jgi:hypothetical protein
LNGDRKFGGEIMWVMRELVGLLEYWVETVTNSSWMYLAYRDSDVPGESLLQTNCAEIEVVMSVVVDSLLEGELIVDSVEVPRQVDVDYFRHFVQLHPDFVEEGDLRNVVEELVHLHDSPFDHHIQMVRMVVGSSFGVVVVEVEGREEDNVPNTLVPDYSDVPDFGCRDCILRSIADLGDLHAWLQLVDAVGVEEDQEDTVEEDLESEDRSMDHSPYEEEVVHRAWTLVDTKVVVGESILCDKVVEDQVHTRSDCWDLDILPAEGYHELEAVDCNP